MDVLGFGKEESIIYEDTLLLFGRIDTVLYIK